MSIRGGFPKEAMPLQPQGRLTRWGTKWGTGWGMRATEWEAPARLRLQSRQLSTSDFGKWSLRYGGGAEIWGRDHKNGNTRPCMSLHWAKPLLAILFSLKVTL